MPAPLSPILVRYVAIRGGAAIGRHALKRYGKRTAAQRMATKAARKGAVPLSPALQGPYVAPIRKSSGGEQVTKRRGTPKTRKSMRGRSAHRSRSKDPGRKMIPRRGKRCPPGYRYDRKRNMCILK